MTCTVRTAGDLVALVPYLVGFHPRESLVLVWLRDARVALTARVDLEAAEEPQALAALIERMVRHSGADCCFLVAYSALRERGRDALLTTMEQLPVALLDACVCDGPTWWSLIASPTLDPADGTSCEPWSSDAAMAAVEAGLAPLASREDLAATIAGPAPSVETDAVADEVVAAVLAGDRGGAPGRMATLLDALVGADREPSVREACELAALLHEPAARDESWGRLDRASAAAVARLWRAVVERVPADMAAAPLCQLGMAGWLQGEGALLSVCLERARALDPAHPPVTLLADIVAGAVPPSSWEELWRLARAA